MIKLSKSSFFLLITALFSAPLSAMAGGECKIRDELTGSVIFIRRFASQQLCEKECKTVSKPHKSCTWNENDRKILEIEGLPLGKCTVTRTTQWPDNGVRKSDKPVVTVEVDKGEFLLLDCRNRCSSLARIGMFRKIVNKPECVWDPDSVSKKRGLTKEVIQQNWNADKI